METKRMIIWTVSALAFMLGWMWLLSYIQKNWPDKPPVAQATTQPAETQPATTQWTTTQFASTEPGAPRTNPTTNVVVAAPAGPSRLMALPATQPSTATEPAVLGAAASFDPTYAMQVRLTPVGAAIEQVTLNRFKNPLDFKKPPEERRPYVFQEPYAGMPDSYPLATRIFTVNGEAVDLTNVVWTQEGPASPGGVAYSVTLGRTQGSDRQPVVKITKTYTLAPRDPQKLGYQLSLSYRLENLTNAPLTVKGTFNGPTLPPRESSRPPDRQFTGGYYDAKRAMIIQTHMVEHLSKEKPLFDLTVGKENQSLAWAGASSVYFSAFVQQVSQDGNGAGEFLGKVTALGRDFEDPNLLPEDRPITMSFETSDVKVAAGQTLTLPMKVFLGPRSRDVLDSSYYATFPRHFDQTLVIRTGMCSICTFDWLIGGMVWLLSKLHWVAGGFAHHGDWGIAIILLVCIVRGVLHPITKRSQVQMTKMGKMGPEMEKLKAKYADDKDELNKQMVQLYKQQGFAPILGCLPMFLQMPIWIALYSALQTTFELRQAPFLWGFTWIHDLAKPDYLIQFSHYYPVPVIGWFLKSFQIDGINILPVLMGVVMFVQQKYQPKPAATTPEQKQQQKMMQWMSLLFPVFLYNGPSGLNLYILTSTAIGIVEGKVVRDHIKQREEAEKARMPELVDAKPTRAARTRKNEKPEPAKKAGFAGWWAEIQQKVEQAKREQDRGKKR